MARVLALVLAQFLILALSVKDDEGHEVAISVDQDSVGIEASRHENEDMGSTEMMTSATRANTNETWGETWWPWRTAKNTTTESTTTSTTTTSEMVEDDDDDGWRLGAPVEAVEVHEVQAVDIGIFGEHVDKEGTSFLHNNSFAVASAEDGRNIALSLGATNAKPYNFLPNAGVLGESSRRALIAQVDVEHTGEMDFKLDLSMEQLADIVGNQTVEQLLALFGGFPDEIKIRRVEADGGTKVINFHLDHNVRTLQVALNDEAEYLGGRLIYAMEAGLQQPRREAGAVTVHDNSIPHAVSALTEGVRYGLFFLQSGKIKA